MAYCRAVRRISDGWRKTNFGDKAGSPPPAGTVVYRIEENGTESTGVPDIL